jgi:PAS domain S-box-containing protein
MTPSDDTATRGEDAYPPEWYRRILEHSSDYVMVVNTMGKVAYVSPAIERVMGYTPDEIIGTDSFENIHPDDLEHAVDSLAVTVEHPDQEVTVEFRAEAKDGSIRWPEARGRNFIDDPVIEGIMVNVRDISERKAREQRVQVLNRILRHNIRNDLNVIRGTIELARDAACQEVTNRLTSALETTDKLLSTSEKSNKIPMELKDVDLSEQDLESNIRRVIDRAQREYPEADIRVSIPESVSVVASEKLNDALWELLENACVHGEEPILISVDPNDESVAIEISDRGPGIPDIELDVIESGEETALKHGGGIGLWVAFWIIKVSQGTLSFEVDDSTTAHISLMKGGE